MSNAVVLGAQWGDEGKGKIVDLLAQNYDVVVRFQGGNNAGHTVVFGGNKYALHLIPSGIFHGKPCVLGNGVVIDPEALLAEMDGLKNVDMKNLLISDRAQVLLFYHKVLDAAKDMEKIGTTGKGIGPCYSHKVDRHGILFMDLLDKERLQELIQDIWTVDKKILTDVVGLSESKLIGMSPLCGKTVSEITDFYFTLGQKLKNHITDTVVYLDKANKTGKTILFEGAQGTHLDIDHGTYPFVTSSTTTYGGAISGSGFGPGAETRIGIVKAYTTRVGEGPFPTELKDEIGKFLSDKGHEFGTTTGRPRRCGWLDLDIIDKSRMVNGLTHLVITKLDVLSGLGVLKIMVNGSYEEHPGWKEDITTVTSYDDLPETCKEYLQRIEKISGVPIAIVSVGPDRKETIIRKEL